MFATMLTNCPASAFHSDSATPSRAGSIYVEAEGAERFDRAYDALQAIALPPDESLAIITDMARQVG